MKNAGVDDQGGDLPMVHSDPDILDETFMQEADWDPRGEHRNQRSSYLSSQLGQVKDG